MKRSLRMLTVVAGAACAVMLAGCGMKPVGPVTTTASGAKGLVQGGQQPVSGATVQLYAVGTGGYGSASRGLLSTPVLTNASGGFSINQSYTCNSGDLIYLAATGGNPGGTGTANNSGLALIAGIGTCGELASATYVSVNELTTVAAVWSLSPFMSDVAHVGSTATNHAGIVNAFAGLNTIVDEAKGTIPGPGFPAGATLPANEMNTLADILAVCVNTVDATSPAGPSTQCASLFNATAQGTTPTDTVQAAIHLARNPTLGLSLGSNVTAEAPFQPTLGGTAPAAWTIAIQYIGGGLKAPKGIAVDAGGNVFAANSGNNSVTKLDTTGTALSGAAGFTAGAMNKPGAIAIDGQGNAWVANTGNSTVTMLSNDGGSGTAFAGNGLNLPSSIAIDSANNVWVTNGGGASVTELAKDGSPVSGADGYTGGQLAHPAAVAINPK